MVVQNKEAYTTEGLCQLGNSEQSISALENRLIEIQFYTYSSYHPPGFKSLPYGQGIRSNASVFGEQSIDMCNHFIDRGFNDHVIRNRFDEVKDVDRNGLLAPRPPSRGTLKLLATKFSPLSKEIKMCAVTL